jgi:penicillin-binding protein 1A
MILRCDRTNEVTALISALEAAEDHRYRTHLGIDPIAIFRAAANILRKRRLEGASTIEQQFVRTCTGKTAISIRRKLEELSITVWLSMLVCKDDIAYSYLMSAYFGYRLCGYRSAISALSAEEYGAAHSPHGAAAIVSLLKRPKPAFDEIDWKIAHQRRIKYVLKRQLT